MFTNYFLKIIYLKIKSRTTTVSVLLLSYINGGNIRRYCCYGCVFLYFFICNLLYIILYKYKNVVLFFEKALFTMFSSSFDNFISRYYNSLKSYIIWFKMKKYFNQIRGYFYQFKYEMQIYNCFF